MPKSVCCFEQQTEEINLILFIIILWKFVRSGQLNPQVLDTKPSNIFIFFAYNKSEQEFVIEFYKWLKISLHQKDTVWM